MSCFLLSICPGHAASKTQTKIHLGGQEIHSSEQPTSLRKKETKLKESRISTGRRSHEI